MKWSSREYLIAFNMVPGIGGRRLQALWRHFGSLAKAWCASPEALLAVEGFGPKTVEMFVRARASICPLEEERWAKALNAQIITMKDGEYPQYLHRLAVPPPVLYVRGTLPVEPGIAIVGTRRPSRVGIAQAREFTKHLVAQGEVIVSGLARGVDYFAHETTLLSQGRTVAVLGSNLGNLYPSEHRGLVERIVQQGAVVSEFSSRCPTVPGNFPRRNRIIAGFSKGVLVVQAGAKSGALGTSDWALELGLDVWAIPGEISDPLRAGTNNLIKQGAHLVTSPQDLGVAKSLGDNHPLTVAKLFKEGLHVNEIALRLNRPVAEIMAEISLLQVAGLGD
ncbi:MAG: DNA-protecting protein DprA [Firmicutes bacterium]|nr:DNA-protecting protein DprA [Bacillota bacterium]